MRTLRIGVRAQLGGSSRGRKNGLPLHVLLLLSMSAKRRARAVEVVELKTEQKDDDSQKVLVCRWGSHVSRLGRAPRLLISCPWCWA